MQKKLSLIITLIILASIPALSQINYFLKAEAGYLIYKNNTIQVDPGPGWRGYYLKSRNGLDVNIINGVSYKKKIFVGAGLVYMNFDGVHGFSIFPEVGYVPLKTRLSPFINLKVGYSHIWNQYENGTGTTLGELGLGLRYNITETLDVYVKSGFLWMQQSALIPLRVGFRF